MNSAIGIPHYAVGNIAKTSNGDKVGKFFFNADSPYFNGHFPNNPILPGVVQVMAATYVATHNTDLVIANIRRCKFTRIVRPCEELTVAITTQQRESTLQAKATVAAQGEQCAVITFELRQR